MTLHRQPDDPGVEETGLPEGMGLFGLALVIGLAEVVLIAAGFAWLYWRAG